jgi:hypothetical protein
MVKSPLETPLTARLGAAAIALIVVVELMVIGPVYFVLEVVGVEPLVV